MRRKYISKNRLEDLYFNKGLNLKECAKQLNCGFSTLWRYFKIYGFKGRSRKETQFGFRRYNISTEKLKDVYLRKKLTLKEISKEFNTTPETIKRYLKDYSIPIRKNGNKIEQIHISERELRILYVEKKLSVLQVAKKLNYSWGTVKDRLKKMGVPLRGVGFYQKGKKDPNLCERNRNRIWTEKSRMRDRISHQKYFQDHNWVKKWVKACQMKPNKMELLLDSILQKIKPSYYKYVGDGKVVIGGKLPDFISADRKRIIEFYGRRWHDPRWFPERDNELERKNYFKQYGFDTLIIWEEELKNIQSLSEKIIKFSEV